MAKSDFDEVKQYSFISYYVRDL